MITSGQLTKLKQFAVSGDEVYLSELNISNEYINKTFFNARLKSVDENLIRFNDGEDRGFDVKEITHFVLPKTFMQPWERVIEEWESSTIPSYDRDDNAPDAIENVLNDLAIQYGFNDLYDVYNMYH